ncbi:hypothetical protein ACGYLS_11870 [Bacillus subtilis]
MEQQSINPYLPGHLCLEKLLEPTISILKKEPRLPPALIKLDT